MQTVISVFDDRETAQRAVERLTEAGFAPDDVHLEASDASSTYSSGTTDMSGATATGARGGVTGTSTTSTGTMGEHRTGGDDKGVMESIGDFFSNLFGADSDADSRYRGQADSYSEVVRRGSYVLVVDANSEEEAERAADMMSELGAVDIDERADEWRASGWTGASYNDSAAPPSGQQMMVGASTSHPSAARMAGSQGSLIDDDRTDDDAGRPPLGSDPYVDNTIADRDRTLGRRDTDDSAGGPRTGALEGERKFDVVEEELQVGKRSIDRGGVRVVQRVSDRPVREIVRLRDERAVVERRDVDRDAKSDDLRMSDDVVVEVHETVEEPVVNKRARVVGEVVVGKEVHEREETISDNLRRKDVDVERLEGEVGTGQRRNLEHADARGTDKDLIGKGSLKGQDHTGTREPKDLPDQRKL